MQDVLNIKTASDPELFTVFSAETGEADGDIGGLDSYPWVSISNRPVPV